MAIERGAGTEIIRCGLFEAVQGTSDALIIQGVQHHIYTILSVILCCQTLNTAGTDHVLGIVRGYDSYAGTTNQNVKLFHWYPAAAGETFIWDNKISFNGFEPTNFSGAMDSAADQDAIADQGSSVAQSFAIYVSHASTLIDVNVTYVDQNNA